MISLINNTKTKSLVLAGIFFYSFSAQAQISQNEDENTIKDVIAEDVIKDDKNIELSNNESSTGIEKEIRQQVKSIDDNNIENKIDDNQIKIKEGLNNLNNDLANVDNIDDIKDNKDESVDKIPNISSDDMLAAKISQTYKIDENRARRIVKTVQKESLKNDLDPILVLSVIATESSFNPKARSHAGALGLMQAIPKWHGDKMKIIGMKHSDLFEIEPNIQLGSMILRDYLDKSKGNQMNALQRYNGSLSDKNRRYSNKVLRHYDWFLGKRSL